MSCNSYLNVPGTFLCSASQIFHSLGSALVALNPFPMVLGNMPSKKNWTINFSRDYTRNSACTQSLRSLNLNATYAHERKQARDEKRLDGLNRIYVTVLCKYVRARTEYQQNDPIPYTTHTTRGYEKDPLATHTTHYTLQYTLYTLHMTLKFLGLVAGIEKSDHGRPIMNKSDRSTSGSKMGDQWSTIGRPLVVHN
jgi:hypothetical protein